MKNRKPDVVKFSKQWESLEQEIEEIKKKRERMEQRFMNTCGIPRVGEITRCPLTEQRMIVQTRELNFSSAQRIWSAKRFGVRLSGSLVDKRGRNLGTSHDILHELEVLPVRP